MDNKLYTITLENTTLENTFSNNSNNLRFVKIGNTAFEISHHYSDNFTYEEVVKNVIKRDVENR